MNKKKLQIELSKLEKPTKQKKYLEQYFTPPDIASDILWLAYMRNELQGKIVADFGSGHGIFAIGATLLGAKKVYAIEIDKDLCEYIKINASKFNVLDKIEIKNMDVFDFNKKVDLVVQNPPFGIETEKGMDRKFLLKALEVSPIVYSIHHWNPNAIKFLISKIPKEYFVKKEKIYEFKLRAFLDTHKKPIHTFKVVLLYCRSYAPP